MHHMRPYFLWQLHHSTIWQSQVDVSMLRCRLAEEGLCGLRGSGGEFSHVRSSLRVCQPSVNRVRSCGRFKASVTYVPSALIVKLVLYVHTMHVATRKVTGKSNLDAFACCSCSRVSLMSSVPSHRVTYVMTLTATLFGVIELMLAPLPIHGSVCRLQQRGSVTGW